MSKPSSSLPIANKHPATVQGMMVPSRRKRKGSDLEAASKRDKQDSSLCESGSEMKMETKATEEIKFPTMLARAFKMECVDPMQDL